VRPWVPELFQRLGDVGRERDAAVNEANDLRGILGLDGAAAAAGFPDLTALLPQAGERGGSYYTTPLYATRKLSTQLSTALNCRCVCTRHCDYHARCISTLRCTHVKQLKMGVRD